MKKIAVVLLSIIALVSFVTANVYAGGKPKPTPFVPHHTTIAAISADSITVQTFNGSKTYKINKYTSISFQGKTVTTAELKVGMKVSVIAGFDPTVAGTITASAPPKDPSPSPSAAKKK